MSYIDELIEKAFSDGYEYAQKEFASIRGQKKLMKKAIDLVNGAKSMGKQTIMNNPELKNSFFRQSNAIANGMTRGAMPETAARKLANAGASYANKTGLINGSAQIQKARTLGSNALQSGGTLNWIQKA